MKCAFFSDKLGTGINEAKESCIMLYNVRSRPLRTCSRAFVWSADLLSRPWSTFVVGMGQIQILLEMSLEIPLQNSERGALSKPQRIEWNKSWRSRHMVVSSIVLYSRSHTDSKLCWNQQSVVLELRIACFGYLSSLRRFSVIFLIVNFCNYPGAQSFRVWLAWEPKPQTTSRNHRVLRCSTEKLTAAGRKGPALGLYSCAAWEIVPYKMYRSVWTLSKLSQIIPPNWLIYHG